MPIVPDEEQFDARMPPWVPGQDELEYGLPEAMLLDDRQQIEMLDAPELASEPEPDDQNNPQGFGQALANWPPSMRKFSAAGRPIMGSRERKDARKANRPKQVEPVQQAPAPAPAPVQPPPPVQAPAPVQPPSPVQAPAPAMAPPPPPVQAPPVAAAPQAEPFDWLPEADKPDEPARSTPATRRIAREQHYRELNEQAEAPVQKPPMTEDEKEKVKEVVRSRASERPRQIRQREEIARQVEKSPEKEAAERRVVEGVKEAVRGWQQPAQPTVVKSDVDVASQPPQPPRDRRYVPSDWRPPIVPLPDAIADITESGQDEFNLEPVMDSERERADKERGDAYASAEFAEQVAATSEMQSHYQHNGLSRLRDVELSLMRSQYI